MPKEVTYKRDNYYNKRDLKELGFTERMIDSHLGEPDLTRPNPFYRSAAPMKLWEKQRVEDAMDAIASAYLAEHPECDGTAATEADAGEEVRKVIWNRLRDERSVGVEKALATKRAKTMDDVRLRIEQIEVYTPDGSDDPETVYEWGMWHWREREELRGRYHCGSDLDVDLATKRRWAVNFIRHNLTNYDQGLYEGKGRVGVHEAYVVYRRAVLEKIAEAYPFLASECMRQR